MTQSQKYAIYLDNLRQKYKYTVDDFCSGVVDPRSFRRYKTGEKTLTYSKIEDFCEKLKINTSDFFFTAKSDDEIEYKKIAQAYQYVVDRNFEAYYKEIKKIDKQYIFDPYNRRFYDFMMAKAGYESRKDNTRYSLATLSKIADYPKCITYQAFDYISLSSLLSIAEIEIKDQNETALHFLLDIVTDSKMIYVGSVDTLMIDTLYADICIFLLRLNRYKAANYIADNGLKYAHKNFLNHSLSYLYYAKAYSLFMLGDQENAEINAVRCLTIAAGSENNADIELFYRTLKKDFKLDPYTFIEKHLKAMLEKPLNMQENTE